MKNDDHDGSDGTGDADLGEFKALTRQVARVAAVTAAYEPVTMKAILKYAKQRSEMLAVRGDLGAGGDPEDLVQAAILDTWTGAVTWDPAVVPLKTHLMSVIRSRTAWRLERSRGYRHLSLEGRTDGTPTSPRVVKLVDASHEAPAPDVGLSLREVVAAAVAWVEEATDDPGVLELVEHYRDGLSRRQEIIAAGMGSEDYINARRRLDRMLPDAPTRLREAVMACWQAA